MPLRVLTDEHVAPEVSHRLQALGYEVACVRDRGLLRREDWELMRWCIDHQYAICTRNRRHFEREHQRCQARGESHYGILRHCSAQDARSRGDESILLSPR